MQKILFGILFSTFFTYFTPVFAANLFRVVLPSAIETTIEEQIKQGLQMALSGKDMKIVLHKAEKSALDAAMLPDVLRLPSEGIVTVIDRPDWGGSWAAEALKKHSKAQPLLSMGFAEPMIGFDAQIGAKNQDYADLVAQGFMSSQGDVLCLFSDNQQWCDLLAASTTATVINRAVPTAQTASMQMASTVSAMTQNPNIRHVFLADLAFYPSVQQALEIIGGTYVIGGIGNSSEAKLDFSIDSQWALQTVLAISALEVHGKNGQELTGSVRIAPRLQ